MRIQCPKCGVPSNVEVADLRTVGAVVRCEVCGARWTPSARDLESPTAVRLQSVASFDKRDVSDAVVIDHIGPGFAKKMPPHRRLESAKRPKKDWRHLKAAGAVFGAVVLAVVVSAPLFSAVPGFASFQGFGDKTSFLSFRDVRTHTIMRGGTRTILVQGEIVNSAGVPVDLPKVRVTLRGADGRAVDTRLVDPVAARAVASGSVGFRSLFAAPAKDDASSVVVSFASPDKQTLGTR